MQYGNAGLGEGSNASRGLKKHFNVSCHNYELREFLLVENDG